MSRTNLAVLLHANGNRNWRKWLTSHEFLPKLTKLIMWRGTWTLGGLKRPPPIVVSSTNMDLCLGVVEISSIGDNIVKQK